MKKILCALLLLTMMLPCAALAQILNLGDFSMDLDPDMPGQIGKKMEGELLLQVYPAYQATGDDQTTLAVNWTSETMDLDSMNGLTLSIYGSNVVEGFKEGFESSGLTISDCSLESIELAKVGGQNALKFDIFATVDYSSLGADYAGLTLRIYQRSYVVPMEDGAYAFVCISSDAESVETYIEPLMATVQWN